MKNKELIQRIDLCKKYLSINNDVFNMLKRNLNVLCKRGIIRDYRTIKRWERRKEK